MQWDYVSSEVIACLQTWQNLPSSLFDCKEAHNPQLSLSTSRLFTKTRDENLHMMFLQTVSHLSLKWLPKTTWRNPWPSEVPGAGLLSHCLLSVAHWGLECPVRLSEWLKMKEGANINSTTNCFLSWIKRTSPLLVILVCRQRFKRPYDRKTSYVWLFDHIISS